jgi:polyribonucleotide nucleotidyltransferase
MATERYQHSIEPDARVVISWSCSPAMVGRIIGKHGTTVKGVQIFTGAVVDIDQNSEPLPTIRIVGRNESSNTAHNIIMDIISSEFKGFALLREMVCASRSSSVRSADIASNYVYAPRLGIFPRRQVCIKAFWNLCVCTCLFLNTIPNF